MDIKNAISHPSRLMAGLWARIGQKVSDDVLDKIYEYKSQQKNTVYFIPLNDEYKVLEKTGIKRVKTFRIKSELSQFLKKVNLLISFL